MTYNMISNSEYCPIELNDSNGNMDLLNQLDILDMPTLTPAVETVESNSGKRKKAAKNIETRKKAFKKPTATSSTTTHTQESTSSNQTNLTQVEENKLPYESLILALNDFRDICQQLSVLKKKYSADTDIRQEVNFCEEKVSHLVDNTEKRINEIPYCRLCLQSPSTNPPQVVGFCGHAFCCISCVAGYLTRTCDTQTGKMHCLVCMEKTNITIYN